MNSATEYEQFTQRVIEILASSDVPQTTKVKHNEKLKGKSGCKHQIDVYWEYEKDGQQHRVAIECKKYNKRVPKEKVCAFQGVLLDLDGVKGILVSKKGFQRGAKLYAKEYGISLKELREPEGEETIIGEINLAFHVQIKRPLYKVDKVWAAEHNIEVPETYQHLRTIDDKIRDSKGNVIVSLRSIEKDTAFEDAYVNIIGGKVVKILEVKYTYITEDQSRNISIDAENFVMAILKDAFCDNPGIRIMHQLC